MITAVSSSGGGYQNIRMRSLLHADISPGRNIILLVQKEWKDGVYTLTLSHNGPLDLSSKLFQEMQWRRETQYLQHRFKHLLHRSIRELHRYELNVLTSKMLLRRELRRKGDGEAIRNYTAQDFINFDCWC